jgi:hypothetical protein
MHVEYPMMFEVSNPVAQGFKTHCGVMEFSAEEGVAVLPHWLMQHLNIAEGGVVRVTNVSLPRATYVKFQVRGRLGGGGAVGVGGALTARAAALVAVHGAEQPARGVGVLSAQLRVPHQGRHHPRDPRRPAL